MLTKDKKSNNYFLIIVGILFISLLFNVVTSLKNYNYKYRIGLESYNNIEEIRTRNERNIELLTSVIDVGSIENMELLQLYENYTTISNRMIDLWNDYSFYESDKSNLASKKRISIETAMNDINGRIQEFLKILLEGEMKTQTYSLQLKDGMFEKFYSMKILAQEIDDYYKNFCANELNGAVDEDKKDKVIKKYLWVDMLEGMNEVNNEFLNIEFTVK